MATGWFYTKSGIDTGPVSLGDLIDLAAVRDIEPDTIVWSTANPKRVLAASVSGLLFGTRQKPKPAVATKTPSIVDVKLVKIANRTSIVAMVILRALTGFHLLLFLAWVCLTIHNSSPIGDKMHSQQDLATLMGMTFLIFLSWVSMTVPCWIVWYVFKE